MEVLSRHNISEINTTIFQDFHDVDRLVMEHPINGLKLSKLLQHLNYSMTNEYIIARTKHETGETT